MTDVVRASNRPAILTISEQALGMDTGTVMDSVMGHSSRIGVHATVSSVVVVVSRSSPNQALMAASRGPGYSLRPSFCTIGMSRPGTTTVPGRRRQKLRISPIGDWQPARDWLGVAAWSRLCSQKAGLGRAYHKRSHELPDRF